MIATTGRWLNPNAELMPVSRSVDRLFEQLFGYGAPSQDGGAPTYALPIDVEETEDAYQLYATVAGVPQDCVNVTFEAGMLSVMVKALPLEAHGKFIRHERPWGNWSRQLELPKEVDSANITAHFENGVLTVRVPKVAKAKPVRIAIGGAAKAIEA